MGGCGWHCTIQDGSSVGDFFAVGAGNVFYDAPAQKTYPEFNGWLYSLDQFIPILNLGMDDFWRPRSGWLYLITVIEQFVGAFLVALSVSGFAGLLTRDERSRT